MEEDDPIVKELTVFLSKQLRDTLYLLQYPLRPYNVPYDNIEHLKVRVKPNQKRIEMQLAVDSNTSNYSLSKGEQIVKNMPEESDPYFEASHYNKQMLVSTPQSFNQNIITGIVRDNEIHLTSLAGVVQMKPCFEHLDRTMDVLEEIAKKEVIAATGGDQAKAVTVKFARMETEEARQRRVTSYEYVFKERQAEHWVDCAYHTAAEESSLSIGEGLYANETEKVMGFNMNSFEYLNKLLPSSDALNKQHVVAASMPTNVLSLNDLRKYPPHEQIRSLIKTVKVIRFSQLVSLLPKATEQSVTLRTLQQCALLIRGCWVAKSEIIYPEESFSASSGIPALALRRCRDYILWRFTQCPHLKRKDVATVFKMPAEEIKEMLMQVALPKANVGWQFMFDDDTRFIEKHRDLCNRQKILWDAKFQELCKVLNIPMGDIKAHAQQSNLPKRRRNSSRSKSISDPIVSQEPATDIPEKIVPELSAEEEEKVDLLMKMIIAKATFITSLPNVKQQITLKQFSIASDHPLASNVPDELCEHALHKCGFKKITLPSNRKHNSPQTKYLRIENVDDKTDLRRVIFNILGNRGRVRIQDLKDESSLAEYNDTEYRKVLKDYVKAGGVNWYIIE